MPREGWNGKTDLKRKVQLVEYERNGKALHVEGQDVSICTDKIFSFHSFCKLGHI